jgi:hypothetical protein
MTAQQKNREEAHASHTFWEQLQFVQLNRDMI